MNIQANVLSFGGLSRMMGNCQVRFLGEEDTATCSSLPDKKTAGVDGQKSLTPKQRLT
ncbi:MAG: hypothetical protein F6K28_42425, partial [Microcoleus sp. SIO2G3]|nr:hypothetical protein [Microcoleus sp. SIO2G3]